MHVYLFSPIPYTFLHQRPQKLADQFVGLSIPVTYIEPCGFTEYRAGRKRGILRLVRETLLFQFLGTLAFIFPFLGRKPRAAPGKGRTDAHLSIVSMPMIFPSNRVDSPFLEKLNAAIYRQVLKWRVFRRMGEGEESIAVVQNPFWGLVLHEHDFSRVTYDCLDEITLFSGKSSVTRYEQYEKKLLDISDAIFVTAEKLEERLKKKGMSIPLVRIPNGVDYEWFQKRAGGASAPSDIAGLKRPVVGYVGVLRDWLNYDLLGHLARTMPEVSFVMVGPLDFEGRIAHLRDIPNLSWLGRKEYQEMPRYINAFDACLIPFNVGQVSLTTNPVKVFEYFALGKPVISTPLYELAHFQQDGLLWIAETKEAFAKALREALAERDDTVRRRRRDVARRHSWDTLARTMLSGAGVGTS